MNSRRPWFAISMPLPAHVQAVQFELARSSIANTTSRCLHHKLSRSTASTTPPIALRSIPFGWHNDSSCIGQRLAPHDRAAATPLFSAPNLAALLDAPVGLTLERRDQRFIPERTNSLIKGYQRFEWFRCSVGQATPLPGEPQAARTPQTCSLQPSQHGSGTQRGQTSSHKSSTSPMVRCVTSPAKRIRPRIP